jgi:hypothetical protein
MSTSKNFHPFHLATTPVFIAFQDANDSIEEDQLAVLPLIRQVTSGVRRTPALLILYRRRRFYYASLPVAIPGF